MICEFRNNLEKYMCYLIGADPKEHMTKETYLSDVIFTILFTIFATLFIVWWAIPFRLLNKVIGNLNINRKFVCNKYKEE